MEMTPPRYAAIRDPRRSSTATTPEGVGDVHKTLGHTLAGRAARLIVAAALMSCFPLAAATTARADDSLAAQEEQMIALVNQERASRGLAALHVDPALQTMARRQAHAMADRGEIYHTPDLGGAARQLGIDYSLLGENVGTGPSVAAVEEAFNASPHHHDNIVEAGYTAVGIGAASGGAALYFSQNFSAPRPVASRSVAPKPVAAKPTAPATVRPARTRARPAAPIVTPAAPSATRLPERPTVDYVRSMDRFPQLAGTTRTTTTVVARPATTATPERGVAPMFTRFFAGLAFWN